MMEVTIGNVWSALLVGGASPDIAANCPRRGSPGAMIGGISGDASGGVRGVGTEGTAGGATTNAAQDVNAGAD